MQLRIGNVERDWDGTRTLRVFDVSDGEVIGECYWQDECQDEWGVDANLEALLWENVASGYRRGCFEGRVARRL